MQPEIEPRESDPLLVLVTAPSPAVGDELARALVEERLCACVHVSGPGRSVYRWQGEVEEALECVLVAKTRASLLPAFEEFLRRRHPYDTPECIAIAPEAVERRYLEWWLGSCGPAGRP